MRNASDFSVAVCIFCFKQGYLIQKAARQPYAPKGNNLSGRIFYRKNKTNKKPYRMRRRILYGFKKSANFGFGLKNA